ncbi:hypothetical protein EJ05DRAFT_483610 [Pseudovirgaria hyperparasitica]|uniref:CFEM domain-containing protein n=1 Tax=Pseudovirgaria hyperparasitica TaxID=470096 RepID=A0A6A6WGP2_9PEZI|nr:uncharacterized protein EJ05DRAFT_483610 [Pseudovirgaria hyperparasitica]KAF2761220.1 hypothetical protein EJ05DRAFT_483610 [Pseudovirgaria hyperparasitica]
MKAIGVLAGVVLLAQTFGFAAAQQTLPNCGMKCLVQSLQTSSCAATDVPCICADSQLINTTGQCVLQECSVVDALTSRNVTATLCNEPVRSRRDTMLILTVLATSSVFPFIILLYLHPSTTEQAAIGQGAWADEECFLVCTHSGHRYNGQFMCEGSGKRHLDARAGHDYSDSQGMSVWVGQIGYIFSIGFTRMSFLFFYLRIFPGTRTRRAVMILLMINVTHTVVYLALQIFSCRPISYIYTSWRSDGRPGSCINNRAFGWSHAATVLALDLVIIITPMPVLYKLKVGTRKKISIMLIFAVGLFVTMTQVLRLHTLVAWASSTNPTYDMVPAAYWSIIEAFVSVICSCLPSFRAWIKRVAPGLLDSAGRSKGYSGYSHGYAKRASERKRFGGDTTLVKSTNLGSRDDGASDVELVDVDAGMGKGFKEGVGCLTVRPAILHYAPYAPRCAPVWPTSYLLTACHSHLASRAYHALYTAHCTPQHHHPP